MSESQQKRICTQSECAYREALEQQLSDEKDLHLSNVKMLTEDLGKANDKLADEKAYNKRLREALLPFAEQPTAYMDDYPCHRGLTTKEKCTRCSKAIEAHNAILGKEKP